MNIEIRRARQEDVETVTTLYRNTILEINSRDYTPEQVRAWSERGKAIDNWLTKIQEQYFLVVEQSETMIGFASITAVGYLDFLFVHKDFRIGE